VARLLRERREELGWSMSAVAEKAGLSQQMVSYVERQLRNPTLDTLLRLTEALDLPLPELLEDAISQAGLKHQKAKRASLSA
jgi:transcriptional regulator with XRE-family HTH domain